MSLEDCKITSYAQSIAGLPDTVTGRAAELKALFDARTDGEVKTQHNALIDALETQLAAMPTTISMEAAIDARVVEIGAGDMAQATYDPQHKRADVFAAVAAADGKGVQLYTCATTASAAAGTAYYTDAACTRQAITLRTLAEPTAVTASGSVYTFSVSGTAYYVTAASVTVGVAAAGSAVYTDAACTQQATDPCALTEAKTVTGHTSGNYAFASGGTAYYLKAADVTGVTHALTGAGENIKFLPDAPYTGGAFTVNGNAVTPKTQAGETPESGLFAAGCMVQAFLHGAQLDFKAAGAGLILRLVGGTTAPANPKAYEVWVNTSVAVGAVTWAAAAPASPAAGDVWVQLGTSASVPIPVDAKETAWIYPSKVWQYESEAWVQKCAQTYQNGAWATMDLSLFLDGVDVTGNTGGITSALYNWGGTAFGNTISIADDILNVTADNSLGVAFAGTTNAVDLTDVHTIHAIVKQDAASASSYYARMGAFSTRNVVATTGPTVWLSTIGSYAQIDLDVSALTGSYYLAFVKACADHAEQIHVQKWWGE